MRIFGLSFKVIKTLLTTQYAYMLEYRIEIALWALSGILPFIMFSLWSQNDVGNTFGLNDVGLARYFLSAFLVRQFSVVWVVFSFEEDMEINDQKENLPQKKKRPKQRRIV